jgi:hypothetical protein
VVKGLGGNLFAAAIIANEYGISIPSSLWAQVGAAQTAGSAQAGAAAKGMGSGDFKTPGAKATGDFVSGFTSLSGELREAGLGSLANLVDAITESSSYKTPTSAGSSVMDAAAKAASGEASKFESVGEAAGQGIAAGMELSQSYIDAAAANMMLQGLASAKSAAGNPKSPAPVFIPLGLTVPQGVAAGIEQGTPLVAAAAAAMMHAASTAATSSLNPGGPESTVTPPSSSPGGPNPFASAAAATQANPFTGWTNWAPFLAAEGQGDGISFSNPNNIQAGAPAPESPTAALSAISSLAQGYANSRGTTINSSPTISISVPQGTSAELASIIAAQVANALDDHDTALVAELAAI